MPDATTITMDTLESRTLLSASMGHFAHMAPHAHGLSALSADLHHHNRARAGGAVVSVDTSANTITVSSTPRHGNPTETTYNVDPAAIITADGNAVTLADLSAGVKVRLRLSDSDPTTAVAITAIGQRVEGSVTAVDTTANTLTLAGRHGNPDTTYSLDANTTILVNGSPGSLGDISAGSRAELKLSALDPTAVLSVRANTHARHHGRGSHGHHQLQAGGSVISVDTLANTLTVSTPSRDGSSTQTTYNVDPNAIITVDGNSSTLGALAAGVKVKLQLSPTDPTLVTAIAAVGRHVEGTVSAVDTTANTLTLAGRHSGPDVTYTLDANTTILIDGSPGSLADITVGARAELKLSALDNTTVLSVEAGAPAMPGDHGGPHGNMDRPGGPGGNFGPARM